MASTGIVAVAAQGLSGILGGKTKVQFIQNNNSVITFDASIKETHTKDSPATEFPVESGQVISDHIIVKPFNLELTGIISDTPIGGLQGLLKEAGVTAASKLLPPVGVVAAAGALSLFSALVGSKSPSVAAYGQLIQLQQTAQPFDVLTSLYRYPSMWITSLSVPRASETGKVLLFTVKLIQLLIVKPQSVNISIFANPSLSSPTQNLGQEGFDTSALQQGRTAGLASTQGALSGGPN